MSKGFPWSSSLSWRPRAIFDALLVGRVRLCGCRGGPHTRRAPAGGRHGGRLGPRPRGRVRRAAFARGPALRGLRRRRQPHAAGALRRPGGGLRPQRRGAVRPAGAGGALRGLRGGLDAQRAAAGGRQRGGRGRQREGPVRRAAAPGRRRLRGGGGRGRPHAAPRRHLQVVGGYRTCRQHTL